MRRRIVGNGFALPAELHSDRLWQDSNLRPSKEPSHISTGELVVHLIAGEWATRYRHFCLPRTEVARPRSNRDLSPPANALHQNFVTWRYLIQAIFSLFTSQEQILAGERATAEH